MNQTHACKSWPHFFQAIKAGLKTHDLRYDDRGFKVGDLIELHEFDPFGGGFTGDTVTVRVTYITGRETPCAFSSAVLERDYVILSIQRVQENSLRAELEDIFPGAFKYLLADVGDLTTSA